MRLATGLRLLLIALAVVGFVAGRGGMPSHAAMTVAAAATHDCCDRAAGAPTERAGPGGDCLGIACPMTAPAVFSLGPVLDAVPAGPVFDSPAAHPLDGRAPPPPLEPPRA